MLIVKGFCLNILSEAVNDVLHHTVFAFQLHGTELPVVHREYLATEGGNVIIARLGMLFCELFYCLNFVWYCFNSLR